MIRINQISEEKEYSLLEKEYFDLFNILPNDLDNMDMFTLKVWKDKIVTDKVEKETKENFERLKRNGSRS